MLYLDLARAHASRWIIISVFLQLHSVIYTEKASLSMYQLCLLMRKSLKVRIACVGILPTNQWTVVPSAMLMVTSCLYPKKEVRKVFTFILCIAL